MISALRISVRLLHELYFGSINASRQIKINEIGFWLCLFVTLIYKIPDGRLCDQISLSSAIFHPFIIFTIKALSIIRFVHLLLFLNPSLATRGTILITLFFSLFNSVFVFRNVVWLFADAFS